QLEVNVTDCGIWSSIIAAYRQRIATQPCVRAGFFAEDYKELWCWIRKYDLSHESDKIDGRPFLIWHGIHDKVVTYEHVKEFVEENPNQQSIQFIEDDIDHLVEPKTMKKITDFFEKEFVNKKRP